MFLQKFEIDPNLTVSAIVEADYRTADVFRKYSVGYCCGGKRSLKLACEIQGINILVILNELKEATRNLVINNQLDFSEWDIDFIINYILNVHHRYIEKSLPQTKQILNEFAKSHVKKFSYLVDLEEQLDNLFKYLSDSLKQEEEVFFPYIRQLAHAHKSKEPYAALLVRTMRKPLEEEFRKSHDLITKLILSIRTIANAYISPENVCTSHRLVLCRLQEMDNDILQHLYIEKNILLPRVLLIEKEILAF